MTAVKHRRLVSLALVASALATPRLTQALPMAAKGAPATMPDVAPKILEGVGITERTGERVPQDISFTDSLGNTVQLSHLLSRRKPVMLTLVYYDCPMLCGLLLSGLTRSLRDSGLDLGRDYEAVTVSFNPRETPALAAQRQGHYLQALGRPSRQSDWAFLVGREQSIHALADSLGFHYRYDVGARQYAHVAAAFVLTPDGRISRTFYGVEFVPRDIKLALVEAGEGKTGTTLQRILLTCYRWNPVSRRYALFLSTYFKAGGLLVFLGLAGLMVMLFRKERARAATR